jgi:hypothetical protein
VSSLTINSGLPSVSVQRSLTLIAKVIQSLANLNSVNSLLLPRARAFLIFHQTVQKEEFMRGVKDFLRDSLPAMIDYILVVSTPTSEPQRQLAGSADNRHDRLSVVNALRQRLSNMPILDQEAIPILPHLLDIPRHLAVIASAVIRSSREYGTHPMLHDRGDRRLEELCSKCFEIEEHALHQVNQLAIRISAERQRPSVPGPSEHHTGSPAAIPISNRSRVSVVERRLSQVPSRPSTAPSSDPNPSRRLLSDSSTLPSFTSLRGLVPHSVQDFQPETNEGQSPSSLDGLGRNTLPRHHLKSISTDGIAAPGVVFEETATRSFADDDNKIKKGLLRGILTRR